MATIVELGVRVDSAQAAQAASNLDKLTLATRRSEQAAVQAEKAWAASFSNLQRNTAQIALELQALSELQAEVLRRQAQMPSAPAAAPTVSGQPPGDGAAGGVIESFNTAVDTAGNVKTSLTVLDSLMPGLLASAGALTLGVGAAAAAVGTLFYSYQQASTETEAYNQALILNGQHAELTATALSDMAIRIGTSNGTVSEAASVLAQLAGNGAIASGSFETIASAAVAMEQATGKSVASTLAEFERIGQDPVKAAMSLNDQYQFLTGSVYAQIVALQSEGDQIGAARVLTDTYAETMRTRATEITGNLGTVASAWNRVKEEGRKALNDLTNLWRETPVGDQVRDLQLRSKHADSELRADPSDTFARQRRDKYDAQLTSVLLTNQEKLNRAAARDAAQRTERTKIEATNVLGASAAASVVSVPRSPAREGLDRIATAKERLLRVGGFDGNAEKLYLQAQSNYNATLQAETLRANQQRALLASLSERQAPRPVIRTARVPVPMPHDAPADAVAQEIVRRQARKSESTVFEGQLERQRAALSLTGERAAQNIGLSDRRAALQNTLNGVEDRFQDQRKTLDERRLATPRDYSEDDRVRDLDILKRAEDSYRQTVIDNYDRLAEAQGDWRNGATSAFQSYQDKAADVAGQTRGLFTNAFSSMEDAVFNFAMTGKFSFTEFTKSVLTDMARLAAQQATSSLLGGLVNLGVSAVSAWYGSSTSTSTPGSSAADYSPSIIDAWASSQANGGAWSNGVQLFAKGGAFTNSIVSTPTTFGMAGGKFGLMGEAGEEAIMPLTRTAGGQLGVMAVGSATGGGTRVNLSAPVNVTVQDRGDDAMQLDHEALQKNLQTQMKSAAERAVAESWRAGGVSYRNANGRR